MGIEVVKPFLWLAAPISMVGCAIVAGAFGVRQKSGAAVLLAAALAAVVVCLAAGSQIVMLVSRDPVSGERLIVDQAGSLRLWLHTVGALAGLLVPVTLWRLLRSVEVRRGR